MNTVKIYSLYIKSEGADLLLINGDFSYDDNTTKWEKLNKDILGADFPIIASAGNHDMKMWDEYKEILTRWQQHPKLSCKGEVGVMNECTFEGIKIVLTSSGVFADISHKENEEFIKNSFKDDKSIWRLCDWHENMTDMQTGKKADESGWGVYKECANAGGNHNNRT